MGSREGDANLRARGAIGGGVDRSRDLGGERGSYVPGRRWVVAQVSGRRTGDAVCFERDPRLVWEWYEWRRGLIGACQPNAAHYTLVEMESHFDEFSLITQNVDGLHGLAGSRKIVELHGNIWGMRCSAGCRPAWKDRTVPLPEIPPRCPHCGALARPDVVWFGESLSGDALDAAFAAVRRCEVMLVIGTSALVTPAASLPLMALQHGATVIEINPKPTPISDLMDDAIRAPAADALPAWWRAWQAEGERGTTVGNSG